MEIASRHIVTSSRRARRANWLLALALVLLIVVPHLVSAAAIPKLTAPPIGTRWFSVEVGGERTGFARLDIKPEGDGYRVESEGAVKMKVMGFSREATSKESYLVGPDLALRSFAVEARVDGSPMVLDGEVGPQGIKLTVIAGGSKKTRTLKQKGPVYPGPVLNLYPLLHGGLAGKTYKIDMLDPESGKVKQVKIEVVGRETIPPGIPVVHLKNNLYPMVDNDIWVDLKGDTVRESVRDDLVVTTAEDEATAKAALADAALSRRDLALDFSLVRLAPPLEHPEQLTRLVLDFTGFPAEFPLLQGSRQQADRLQDGTIRFTMPYQAAAPPVQAAPAPGDLASEQRIPSDAPEIVAKKNEIVGGEKDPAVMARLLATWVAKEIKPTVTDDQSPLETLKNQSGNCQAHARLYTALARAAGIPTRFVAGLVYLPGQGFLYHAWAESYLKEWVPLDPTFGEMPANLTHIKLVQGESPDDLALLASVVGRIKARLVDKSYQQTDDKAQ